MEIVRDIVIVNEWNEFEKFINNLKLSFAHSSDVVMLLIGVGWLVASNAQKDSRKHEDIKSFLNNFYLHHNQLPQCNSMGIKLSVVSVFVGRIECIL